MTSPTPSAATPFEAAPDTGAVPPASSAPPRGCGGTSSPGRIAWRRFRRDRAGVVSAYLALLFFVAGIGAPLIAKVYGKDPYTTYGQNRPGLLNQFGFPIAPNGGIRWPRRRCSAPPVRMPQPGGGVL
ncbi:hypothetical protein ACFZC6_14255 [Streptomyces ossamyceticus]|uniref:hypothetical protein n=1 Tax=Streptomyces ossamyceticus TaxID=249581 RepID=UPI0036F135D9